MPRNYGSCGTDPSSESLYVNLSADNMNGQQTTLPRGAPAARGREIPDSQEDEADYNLSRGREIPDSQDDEADYALSDSVLGGYLSETDEDDEPEDSKHAILSSVRQTNNTAVPSFVFRPQPATSLPSTIGAPSVSRSLFLNCPSNLLHSRLCSCTSIPLFTGGPALLFSPACHTGTEFERKQRYRAPIFIIVQTY